MSINPKSDPEYFHALDGIRGILAVVIALYHTSWLSNIAGVRLLINGPIVVDFFFVLSGFIMFQLYSKKINTTHEGISYLKKRIARIYPLHLFTLITMTGYLFLIFLINYYGYAEINSGETLFFQSGSPHNLKSLFANLTLTQSIGILDNLSFNTPSWSISVEFFAYIFFALMMIFFRPNKAFHFVIIAVAIITNYAILSQIKPNLDFHYDLGIFRCLGGFYTGVLVSWVLGNIKSKAQAGHKSPLLRHATSLEVIIMAILILFFYFAIGKLQFFIAPIAFIFVLIFALGNGAVSKLLSSRPAVYLGKISYSIYMVHMLICLVFGTVIANIIPRIFGESWNIGNFGGDILIILYLMTVWIVSHLTYHWIEAPGRKVLTKKLKV